jgi:hypothetical protein
MNPYRIPAQKEKTPMDSNEKDVLIATKIIVAVVSVAAIIGGTCVIQTILDTTPTAVERAKADAMKAMWEKYPLPAPEKK